MNSPIPTPIMGRGKSWGNPKITKQIQLCPCPSQQQPRISAPRYHQEGLRCPSLLALQNDAFLDVTSKWGCSALHPAPARRAEPRCLQARPRPPCSHRTPCERHKAPQSNREGSAHSSRFIFPEQVRISLGRAQIQPNPGSGLPASSMRPAVLLRLRTPPRSPSAGCTSYSWAYRGPGIQHMTHRDRKSHKKSTKSKGSGCQHTRLPL